MMHKDWPTDYCCIKWFEITHLACPNAQDDFYLFCNVCCSPGQVGDFSCYQAFGPLKASTIAGVGDMNNIKFYLTISLYISMIHYLFHAFLFSSPLRQFVILSNSIQIKLILCHIDARIISKYGHIMVLLTDLQFFTQWPISARDRKEKATTE